MLNLKINRMRIGEIKNDAVRAKALYYVRKEHDHEKLVTVFQNEKNVPIAQAFEWDDTDERHEFWQDINNGKDLELPNRPHFDLSDEPKGVNAVVDFTNQLNRMSENNKKVVDELVNGEKQNLSIDKDGNIVEPKVKSGDKVRMVRSNKYDDNLTIGKAYKVIGIDGEGVYIIDDVGENNYLLDYQYELVKECDSKYDVSSYLNNYHVNTTTANSNEVTIEFPKPTGIQPYQEINVNGTPFIPASKIQELKKEIEDLKATVKGKDRRIQRFRDREREMKGKFEKLLNELGDYFKD